MSEPLPASPPLLRLDLTEPQRHLVDARLTFTPTGLRPGLRLPAWTPGSYLIRDYVRQLEGLEAWQGNERLQLLGAASEGWSLRLTCLEPVEIRYRIMATELTVRTSHLNGDHGFLALAGVALRIETERWSPHHLELRLPAVESLCPPPPGRAGAVAGQQLRPVDRHTSGGGPPSLPWTQRGGGPPPLGELGRGPAIDGWGLASRMWKGSAWPVAA